MSNYSHNTYGCGCGNPTIVVDPGQSCDGCIVAPKILWGCDVGPDPGSTMTFSIPALTNIKTPDGHTYTYELYDFDQTGFNSVTVSGVGSVVAKLHMKYEGRKKYRIRYKIRQDGGIQSKTGEIFVCVKNICSSCAGDCNQLNGDCAIMNNVISTGECGIAWEQLTPNWNVDGVYFSNVPWFVTNIAYNIGLQKVTGTISGSAPTGIPYVINVTGVKGIVTTSATITITIEDKSIGVVCPPYEVANKCTGDCESAVIDLEVSGGANLDISVN